MPRAKSRGRSSYYRSRRSSYAASLNLDSVTGDQLMSLYIGLLKCDADRARMFVSQSFKVDRVFAELGGMLGELLTEAEADVTLATLAIEATGIAKPMVALLLHAGYDDTAALVNAGSDTTTTDAAQAQTGISSSQVMDAVTTGAGLLGALLS